jgi:membrane-associated phospholipid phosphatase
MKATLIMAFFITVLIPLISILVMRGLKLISSLDMEDSKERIGPLIATTVFYIWFYINVSGSEYLPKSLAMITLGGAIAISLAFFINIFSKISLHTVGATCLFAGIGLLMIITKQSYIDISLPWLGDFSISSIFAFLFSILLLGLTASSRLILGAHQSQDIYGGMIVGLISQLIAYRIYY